MEIRIVNKRALGDGYFFFLTILLVSICNGCTPDCNRQIVIYQGLYFQKGQKVQLSIDDKILFSKTVERDLQRNDLKEFKTYCCTRDSCRVNFVLGDNDTTFFISPLRTKRLMIGSDIFGKFSVATDDDKGAWMEM